MPEHEFRWCGKNERKLVKGLLRRLGLPGGLNFGSFF